MRTFVPAPGPRPTDSLPPSLVGRTSTFQPRIPGLHALRVPTFIDSGCSSPRRLFTRNKFTTARRLRPTDMLTRYGDALGGLRPSARINRKTRKTPKTLWGGNPIRLKQRGQLLRTLESPRVQAPMPDPNNLDPLGSLHLAQRARYTKFARRQAPTLWRAATRASYDVAMATDAGAPVEAVSTTTRQRP